MFLQRNSCSAAIICLVFVFMPHFSPLSCLAVPRSCVQQPESSAFWSVSLLTCMRQLTSFTGHTEGCDLKPMPWLYLFCGRLKGLGIMSWSPWTLVHATADTGSEAGKQAGSHTWEFTEGEMPAFVMGCSQRCSNRSWSNGCSVNARVYYKAWNGSC